MNWQIASFVLLCIVLAAGFAWYERSRPPAKVLSLVAALAALATVGRIAFAPIPNVKPTTDIAFFAGYALGPVPGFAVGAVAALASNVFFGQGPWTPWQMVGWGVAGLLGGLVAKAFGRDLGRWQLAGFCALAGVIFGVLLDTYQWVQGAEQDLEHWVAVSATSLPYNIAHVVGNIGFCLLLGPTFVRSLSRYRRRFSVQWALPAVVALLVLPLAAPPGARASSSSAAVSYLRGTQNSDGGFGASPGSSSTGLHTGWVALGFAAAGVNPADVTKDGQSIVDFLQGRAAGLKDIGEIERTVLAVDASGLDARSFGGRDLVAAVERRRSANGSWKGNNGWTAFGVLSLKATGGSGVRKSARWLTRHANGDGGFGFRPGAASDVDDTGAALQAFAAAGLDESRAARRAVAFLRRAQNGDGGFGLLKGQASNAQSTSWAVQGIVAIGRRPAKFKRNGRTPLRFLRSLQAPDGSVRYSRSSKQTPVWVTAQALDAFEQKPFPLAPAPRASSHQRLQTPESHGRQGPPSPPMKPVKPKKKARKTPPPSSPPPAPPPPAATPSSPTGPTGPTGAESSTPSLPPSADARRTASQAMDKMGGSGSGSAWVPIALVAGVAALAAWRLMRRRTPT